MVLTGFYYRYSYFYGGELSSSPSSPSSSPSPSPSSDFASFFSYFSSFSFSSLILAGLSLFFFSQKVLLIIGSGLLRGEVSSSSESLSSSSSEFSSSSISSSPSSSFMNSSSYSLNSFLNFCLKALQALKFYRFRSFLFSTGVSSSTFFISSIVFSTNSGIPSSRAFPSSLSSSQAFQFMLTQSVFLMLDLMLLQISLILLIRFSFWVIFLRSSSESLSNPSAMFFILRRLTLSQLSAFSSSSSEEESLCTPEMKNLSMLQQQQQSMSTTPIFIMRIICAVLAIQFCTARLFIPIQAMVLLLPATLIPLLSHHLLSQLFLMLSALPTLLLLGWRACCLKLLLSLMMIQSPALSTSVGAFYLYSKQFLCRLEIEDLLVTCWLAYYHWLLHKNRKEAQTNFEEALDWRKKFEAEGPTVIGDDYNEIQKNNALKMLEKGLQMPDWYEARKEGKIILERGNFLVVACQRSKGPFWIWSVKNSPFSQELSILKKSIFDSATTLVDNLERLIFADLVLKFIKEDHETLDPRTPLVALAIEHSLSKGHISINLGLSSLSSRRSESTRLLSLIFLVCKFYKSLKNINKINIICIEDSFISFIGEKTRKGSIMGNKRSFKPAGAALEICLNDFQQTVIENNHNIEIRVKVNPPRSQASDLWLQDLNSKLEHVSHLINKQTAQHSIISSKEFVRNLSFMASINCIDSEGIPQEIQQEQKMDEKSQSSRFYTPNIPYRKTDAELRGKESVFSRLLGLPKKQHRSVSIISKATKTVQISSPDISLGLSEYQEQIKSLLTRMYQDIYIQHVLGSHCLV